MPLLGAGYRWLECDGTAPGAPGLEPRWTSSDKDAVGTAYSAACRVWYTVSHGILNEIYYPTIDRAQVRDVGLLITDGESFVHEEKRDLVKSFEYIDSDALGLRYINRDPAGRYTITKEIIADPHNSVVLQHVSITGDPALLSRLKVYCLLAPHLEGGGAGNYGRALDVAGRKILLAWKPRNNHAGNTASFDPSSNGPHAEYDGSEGGASLAMAVDCGFSRVSCGFVGTSDGWQDLTQNLGMKWEYGSALNGNIALMGEIPTECNREFTLAIGFGSTRHAAITKTLGSLATPYELHVKRFVEQWRRAGMPHELAQHSGDGGRLLRTSLNVLLAHEDKTYAGAFIASASIPWGQHKGDDDLGGYHLVWTRDMVQTASALLACGRTETARRALVYLACTQKPDGGFSQNFWVDGRPYWTGVQLDEVAFPIILAWRLWKREALGEFDVVPFVSRAAAFLVRHAPITQQERWEEVAGYSPSTLAAVISALICASEIVGAYGQSEMSKFLAEHADWIDAHLEDWTVTNEGVLDPEIKRHYMRVRPPECGAPYARPDCGGGLVRLANVTPGGRYDFEAREIVDGGFLELVRYGVRRADDPVIAATVKVIDRVLKAEVPQGDVWYRYNHDGYGSGPQGEPYLGYGIGRPWPLLTGERAHYELALGADVYSRIRTIEALASQGGMLPEQVWDVDGPPGSSMVRGLPSGSAMPLVWAHAEYLKLLRSVEDGQVFDRIDAVYQRYCCTSHRLGIEVFKLRRQITTIPEQTTLRVITEWRFRLLWTIDQWKTVSTVESRSVGSAGYFADVPAQALTGAQQVSFTLYWPDENRWEGRNFDIAVTGLNTKQTE